LAQKIEQLIHAQPFPPTGPAGTGAKPRIPDVFVPYLEMAQTVDDAGKE
jgi:hypothetical protein